MAFEDYIINNKFIFDYMVGDFHDHFKINLFEFKIEFSVTNLESFISFAIVDDKITYFNKLIKHNMLFGQCDIHNISNHKHILTKYDNSYKDIPYHRMCNLSFKDNIIDYKNEILDLLFKELIELNSSMKRKNNRFEYTKYRSCYTSCKKSLFDKLIMIDNNLQDRFNIIEILE